MFSFVAFWISHCVDLVFREAWEAAMVVWAASKGAMKVVETSAASSHNNW
jgi:hypothetical protein